jgi:hypothetical protein
VVKRLPVHFACFCFTAFFNNSLYCFDDHPQAYLMLKCPAGPYSALFDTFRGQKQGLLRLSSIALFERVMKITFPAVFYQ